MTSLLCLSAYAETPWLKMDNNPKELSRLYGRAPLQFLFIPSTTARDSNSLSRFPSLPSTNELPYIWEEWGLTLKPLMRADVIDSTDSLRFFGRIHKAAVWDAKVR